MTKKKVAIREHFQDMGVKKIRMLTKKERIRENLEMDEWSYQKIQEETNASDGLIKKTKYISWK